MDIKALRSKLGLSQQELADKTGIPKGRINNWEQGKGQPKAQDYQVLQQFFATKEVKVSRLKVEKGGATEHQEHQIPYFDTIATAGMAALHADQSPITQPTETINPGTWFRSATAAMRVYGDSMFPKYRGGCVIALKEIYDKEEIIWGEDYVVETGEQRVFKRVQRSEKGDEYIELTSINPQTDARGKLIYAPKDFHLSKIRRIYKVLGQINYESGGDTIVHR